LRHLNFLNKLDRYWFCFIFFTVSNALLAYGHWDLETNLFIAFYGMLLPGVLFLFFQFRKIAPQTPENTQTFIPNNYDSIIVPNLLWVSFCLFFLITRFYKLESIPFWPIKDDGHFAIQGIALSQKWHWQILWGECQSEPLILWILGIYFKFIEPSLFSLRFFPLLISAISILLGYWAARQFFTKSFSFLFAFFLAFGFWSFFYSRIDIGAITVFPLQFAAFGWLGVSLNRLKNSSVFKISDILILGILSGLGFYTYTVWPVVFLSVLIVLISKAVETPKNLKFVFFYGLIVLMTAFPMVLARLGQGGLTHIQDQLNGSSPLHLTVSYLTMLFWNGLESAPDGPVWGGVFNPVEGALIFLGFLSLGLNLKSKFSQWSFLSLFLLALPGVLGKTFDICHITQLLPLFCLGLVLGFEKLMIGVRSHYRWWVLAPVLLLSLILNIYHYLGPSQDWKSLPAEKNDWTPVEYAKAYEILREVSRQSGSGYIFSEFNLDQFNKTLSVASYAFDALQNPKLSSQKPKWSALLINKYYIPFLKKRYPQSRWVILKKDDVRYHSDLSLGLIPTDSMTPQELDGWKKADRICRDTNLAIRMKAPPVSWMFFRNDFLQSSNLFEKDRFLDSVFWEKIALLDSDRIDYGDTARDFQKAIHLGYPTANLFYNLGMVLKLEGDTKGIKKALREAGRAQKLFFVSEPNL
jgi:hypothetical protein